MAGRVSRLRRLLGLVAVLGLVGSSLALGGGAVSAVADSASSSTTSTSVPGLGDASASSTSTTSTTSPTGDLTLSASASEAGSATPAGDVGEGSDRSALVDGSGGVQGEPADDDGEVRPVVVDGPSGSVEVGGSTLSVSFGEGFAAGAAPVSVVVVTGGASGPGSVVAGPVDAAAGRRGVGRVVGRVVVSGGDAAAAGAAATGLGLRLAGPVVDVEAFASDGGRLSVFPHEVVVGDDGDGGRFVEEFRPGAVLEFGVSDDVLGWVDVGSLRVMSRPSGSDGWRVVPSAFFSERGVVVAHVDHLSEFVLVGSEWVPGEGYPVVVIDPDDNVGWTFAPNGAYVGEMSYNWPVVSMMAAGLVAACPTVQVVLTRDASEAGDGSKGTGFVDRSIRAARAANYGPDVFMTVAFNTFNPEGLYWGKETNGGPGLLVRPGASAAEWGLGEAMLSSMLDVVPRPFDPPKAVRDTGSRPWAEFAVCRVWWCTASCCSSTTTSIGW